jgi:hypothetical protein
MNNSNNNSKQTASTLDTSKVQTRGRTIEVKVEGAKRSPASKLSSRPSRSIFKAKSLMKPGLNLIKKTQENKNV